MEPGTLVFTEKVELDDTETQWLADTLNLTGAGKFEPDIMDHLMDLEHEVARNLFLLLWQNNVGNCLTCGASEGQCDNVTCTRTRITNKLFLWNYGFVPPEWREDQFAAMQAKGTPIS